MTFFGLNTCKSTIVGNDVMRGVSGGQKRRVTSGEFCVTPTLFKFMDSISNGLDSATTFDIVRCIRATCDYIGGTVVISLLQVIYLSVLINILDFIAISFLYLILYLSNLAPTRGCAIIR